METADSYNLSLRIKEKALELGFDICGIARARALKERESSLKAWLEAGMNDKMGYLEREPEKRFNPGLVFPGTKSLVVTGISYYSEIKQKEKEVPVLSRYTYGTDYHDVILPKLEKILTWVKERVPEAEGKAFSDTGFLHEKSWINEAGLGWQGRHSIMISKEIGSFFFIGILMLNIELDYDEPFKGEFCGSCRLCIDYCPTSAINDNRTIDARKCISNRTIENRGPIPEEIIPKLGGRVYGCDKCQEVCPWNKNIKPNSHPEFIIDEKIAGMSREEWESLTEDQFQKLFKKTALVRIKYEDFMRNISAALKSIAV
ncbi:MAG: tRNA epoxyqueuosine(34) reductase QueG [Bacteroidetes bacterium RBG_13_43_22]|nr:MAG: tRNA epoxyqueuosine(34) reductase QueG [Bacteroidetes bacterium RBG_13_43_22]